MPIMLAFKFVWEMSPVPIKPKTQSPMAYRVPLGALIQNINQADVIPEFNALKAAAETATQTATDASITSADALQRASQAQEQVVGAAVSADQALDAASVAQTAAATAAINAGQAKSDAAQAQTAAAQVLTTALNAETTANAASIAATDAQTLAHTAAIDAAAAAGQVAGAVADLPLVKSQVEIALLGTKPFATVALMNAFTPGTNDPKVALVGNDPTPANRGYYYWDATASAGAGGWVKSPYDPSAAADTAAAEVLPTAGIYQNGFGGITVTDVKGNPIMFTTAAGLLYAVTLQGYTSIEQIGKLLGVANTFDPAEQLLLLTDGKYNPILFQTVGGLLHAPTLQNVVRPDDIGGLLMLGEAMSPDETMQMLVRDRKFSPAIFATPDSRVYIPNLQGYASKDDLANAGGGGGYNPYRGTIRVGVSVGQSNTMGSGATKTSLTQPYKNLMMNLPNNQTRYSERNASGVLLYAPTGLIPLVELGVESTLSVTINELTRRILTDRLPVNDVVFAGYCTGNGGTRFELLSKGAAIMPDNDDPPNALNDFAINWYDCMKMGLADIIGFINLTGKVPLIDFVNITEGEADTVNRTSKQAYMDLQRGYISDFSEECYTITGKPFSGVVVFNQCCAMRSYVNAATYAQFRRPWVPQAQLEMGLNDAAMVLACPDYPFARSDYVHFSADTQPLHCAYKARALKAWYDGKKWLPTHIKKCEWFSDHVILTYHVPHGRLQIETGQVAAATNYGFDIWQPAVNDINLETVTAAITSVVIDGVDRIRINLAADYPAGSLLTYAWGRVDDPLACAGPTIGPRGNIADTHGRTEKFTLPVSLTVYNMHNYAVVQDFTRT